MPEINLAELKGHVDQAREQLLAKIAAQEEQVNQWKEWYEQMKAAGADPATLKSIFEQIEKMKSVESRLGDVESKLTAPGGSSQMRQVKLVGQQFAESEDWKQYAKRMWHKGGVSLQVKGSLFDGHPLFEHKTTIDSTAIGSSTPGILVPQRLPGVAYEGVRRLRVRDLLPRIPTTNNSLEWVKTNTITHAASPQVEASSKDESAYTYTIDSVPVRTLAHWIPATRQVLDDAAFLSESINIELLKGLADKEDAELLTGDGTGQHISGLTTEATAYNTGLNVSGDTRIDKLSHALLQLEQLERMATGIVLNPADWRAITLVKTDVGGANTGEYIMGSPAAQFNPLLWSVPVAITTAMTSGKFLVGDFAAGAVVGDRMEARIDVSTEHSDFFVKNMVAIRAEERLCLVVRRADYFVYGSF